MKRILLSFLTMVLCLSLCLPYMANGASQGDSISLGKSTYMSGEYMEIIYNFTEPDGERWVCVYKDSCQVSNMVFAYPATVYNISGYYLPNVGVGVNGYQKTTMLTPGNYLLKVMYIPEGGNYMDAANFSEGKLSHLTYSFKITANNNTTPTISVANKTIKKNGDLTVSYSGISYILENRTLSLVVTNQNGKTVKTRQLLSEHVYSGISGETTISLSGLASGTYKVGLVSNDNTFTISQAPIEITVTDQVDSSKTGVFPADIFKNKDICGQYFANADKNGVTYDVVDGEYVMNIPYHMGFDYLYTWEPIPYDNFTVSFDFLLKIYEDSLDIADEMDFLFGMSEDTTTHHQLTIGNTLGDLSLAHWTRTLDTPYVNYVDDSVFCDIYDEEKWYTLSVQFTPDEITVFLDGEELVTLEESAGCVGDYGRIGLRGGSRGGWSIKNLMVYEGSFDPDVVMPTEAPATQTPVVTATPTPTEEPVEKDGGNGLWIILVVVAVVVVCGIGTTAVVLAKKKK